MRFHLTKDGISPGRGEICPYKRNTTGRVMRVELFVDFYWLIRSESSQGETLFHNRKPFWHFRHKTPWQDEYKSENPKKIKASLNLSDG